MESSEPIQFSIEVSDMNAAVEDIDEMTRQLLSELREMNVESAELTKGGPAPRGSKGDFVTLGSIAVSVLPAVLPNLISLVRDWAGRGHGRTVKFKGMGIEFEGSPEEFQKLMASLDAGGKVADEGKRARSPKIFISYRRSDSADVTGRIYDRLVEQFGKSAIFKDVHSIPPGIDFREHLGKAVGKCKIFLVIIGDQWLEVTDAKGKKRLKDPDDFVRIEIESALQRDIPIIPLLVRGATMPAEAKLPRTLRELAFRNGIPVRADPDFHRDMDRLIEAVSGYSSKKS
ncbi:MAG TPA: toll/interleukin-1 receptor domain-containing protein [Anaerolineales bacterium]|nr:toll/interleukin-1 receptor domain-containing protein [Anaerolineales bacterium]